VIVISAMLVVSVLAVLSLDGGDPTLFEAVKGNDVQAVKVLIGRGADVNARSEDGNTPLAIAVYEGHVEMADLLLAAGAEINAKYPGGATVVMTAVFKGRLAILKELLRKGADPNAAMDDGLTPLMMAASLTGRPQAVETVGALLDAGAKLDSQDDQGETALIKAVDMPPPPPSPPRGMKSSIDFDPKIQGLIIEALLAHGANVRAKRKDGKTAADVAAKWHNRKAVEVLKRAGTPH
jgi:ankyrin repeat protein